jgi:hypothetical protein
MLDDMAHCDCIEVTAVKTSCLEIAHPQVQTMFFATCLDGASIKIDAGALPARLRHKM